ncbi:MmcQ/YjbR family DNA-binding protein [Octadecabacter arcticus]|uniref:MmcQ/YjbR family DNA-binding protein n=1 Tax=Octadecabacter arcticus TaxID=53946 RepID=UPI00018087F9
MTDMLTRGDINAFCATLPFATHVVQWGNSDVWKVGGKLFAVCGWYGGKPAVTFKASPIAFEVLPDMGGIRPAPYFASRGMKWLQDTRDPGLPSSELKTHIIHSHAMPSRPSPRKSAHNWGCDPL